MAALSAYELERMENIRRNTEVLRALGVTQRSMSLQFSPEQKENRRRKERTLSAGQDKTSSNKYVAPLSTENMEYSISDFSTLWLLFLDKLNKDGGDRLVYKIVVRSITRCD